MTVDIATGDAAEMVRRANYNRRRFPKGNLGDRILDALDDAPIGTILLADSTYVGRILTVQQLAAADASDSGVLRVAKELLSRNLVQIFDARDALTGYRRLFISGGGL